MVPGCVGEVGPYVVAGDAHGDPGQVNLQQGQLAGPEVVARALAEPLRDKGTQRDGELVDPAGGLDRQIEPVVDRLDRLGGAGAVGLGDRAVRWVGVEVEHVGRAECAGDVTDVEADAAAGDHQHPGAGPGREVRGDQ